MSKKDNESVLKQVAEVRIGDYEAVITESDMKFLYEAHEQSFEGDILHLVIDYLISVGEEKDEDAGRILNYLSVILRAMDLYHSFSNFDIRKLKKE